MESPACSNAGDDLGLVVEQTKNLELNPNTVTPVAATVAGLAPAVFVFVVVGPLPVVVVDAQAPFGFVVVFLFYAPAVAFVVADNGGRGRRREKC